MTDSKHGAAAGRPRHRFAGVLFVLACCGLVAVWVLLALAWGRFGTDRAPEPTPAEIARLCEVFGGEFEFAGYPHRGVERSSLYLAMRDGEHMAVDLYLPRDLGAEEKLPVILVPTRYWRRWDVRAPAAWYAGPDLFTRVFVASGYAILCVDARGSGASTGVRPHPWSADEIADYGEILTWAVAQDWCSGLAGATGISYGGTAAEFAGSLGHPALKAVAPRFSLFDTYADIAFPGGVLNEQFVESWGRFNTTLDQGRVPGELGLIGELLLAGPAAVPCGTDALFCGGSALDAAIADHAANVDIYQAAVSVACRDEYQPAARTTVDGFSPHCVLDRLDASGVAVYSWSGWGDGAYAASALARFMSQTGPGRAVVGPWNHAGGEHVSPYLPPDSPTDPSPLVQVLELRRFFDFHLKGMGAEPAREVVYFTMGEERWHASPVWPPEGVAGRELYLAAGNGLAWETPDADNASDEYAVDFTAGSGSLNRWRTQLGRSDVQYPQWAESDQRRLVYAGEPLERDMEITGTAVATLFLAASADDGAVFAYLEAEDAAGEVRLLSEGMLRFEHRGLSPDAPYFALGPWHSFTQEALLPCVPGEIMELVVDLLPVSVRVPAGSRLRLALAGADADQFARLPAEGGAAFTVYRGAQRPSRLTLPVLTR